MLFHAWFVLSKLQNSLLLLETPADLASTIDSAIIQDMKSYIMQHLELSLLLPFTA